MHFQKQDLVGDHYNWANTDKQNVYLGQPSRRLFDRLNGEQVLFLINFISSLSDRFTLEEARRIEMEIASRLPLEAKSEISVFNWIREMDLSQKHANTTA